MQNLQTDPYDTTYLFLGISEDTSDNNTYMEEKDPYSCEMSFLVSDTKEV